MTQALQRAALVISSTPPVPRDYGNRNRVHQTIEFLRSMGYDISFLLYPFDQDWEASIPEGYRQLVAMFDYFAVVPNSRPLHQNARGEHHGIDEWWDETLELKLRWLLARKTFDVMFVNYAFFSRAFDFAPRNCLKILDTHDIFTGRREMFETFGVAPEFFYTAEEQEKIAFERADAVIAIKPSEADHIGRRTNRFVVSLPYWDSEIDAGARSPLAADFTHERPLRIGFVGAQNSVNSVNMNRFLARFSRFVRLYDLPVEVVIAGNAGRQIEAGHWFVRKLGRVSRIGEFYRDVDVVAAPLEFSTGIKIKVAEAMGWGLPVVATVNAFDGFQAFHRLQTLPSVESVCEALAALALGECGLAELAEASRRSGQAAEAARDKGFSDLRQWIRQNSRRNVAATTRAFWRRRNFADELFEQSIEFAAQNARTIVLVPEWAQPEAEQVHAPVEFIRAPERDWPRICLDVAAFGHIQLLLIGLGAEALQGAGVKAAKIMTIAPRRGSAAPPSEPSAPPADVARPSPLLRYAPLGRTPALEADRVVIVSSQAGAEWDETTAEAAEWLCAQRGLEAHRIGVASDGWDDEAFFAAVVAETASRWLLIGHGAWAPLLQQTAVYRHVACMVARPDLLAPQIADAQGRPSLMRSLAAFLDGHIQAAPVVSPDFGWDGLWT